MRELRVSRSSSDCMDGSGARQAADVKLNLKSYITKGTLLGLGLGPQVQHFRHAVFGVLCDRGVRSRPVHFHLRKVARAHRERRRRRCVEARRRGVT